MNGTGIPKEGRREGRGRRGGNHGGGGNETRFGQWYMSISAYQQASDSLD